jgi:hypothetical protein
VSARTSPAVDAPRVGFNLPPMSIAEVKATISKMTVRQRHTLQRYLVDLEMQADEPKPGTLAWRREMARRIDEVLDGRGFSHEEVRAMIKKHCR